MISQLRRARSPSLSLGSVPAKYSSLPPRRSLTTVSINSLQTGVARRFILVEIMTEMEDMKEFPKACRAHCQDQKISVTATDAPAHFLMQPLQPKMCTLLVA